ncbi:hypothetical protein [Gottfriedia acidiceleris]|uniref:hypothetical protein n=1 Tax=Gottfriedia acidiceleris TaxID=371036 RepID=UPI002FFE2BFE
MNKFKEIAKKRWEYLNNDDSTKGNKYYDELLSIAKDLHSENKLHELCVLLENENIGVQFESASKLLTLSIDKVVKTLETITEKKGTLPFSAKMTLRQWRAGNLKF